MLDRTRLFRLVFKHDVQFIICAFVNISACHSSAKDVCVLCHTKPTPVDKPGDVQAGIPETGRFKGERSDFMFNGIEQTSTSYVTHILSGDFNDLEFI